MLTKLSSISTQSKMFEDDDDSESVPTSISTSKNVLPKAVFKETSYSAETTTITNEEKTFPLESSTSTTLVPTTIETFITTNLDSSTTSTISPTTVCVFRHEGDKEDTLQSKVTSNRRRHTFFDGPLIVEQHNDWKKHSPKYTNDCQHSNDNIHPYLSPNLRSFLDSLSVDLPKDESLNEQRRHPIIYLHQPHFQFHI
ncbi:uncharacterized protein LOC116341218 [Contarinia nasturtii]|uniref:uncharacterized protein LOC116341218 n=1 Tax=Contarinia nasturtii TaxID=265458 RepID=UPI0012D4677F|nr:uncharacterized protein LOC116341218 [Contarinia nasturtii]